MNGNGVTYDEVKRKAFDEVADLCIFSPKERNPYTTHVTVEYNGNPILWENAYNGLRWRNQNL